MGSLQSQPKVQERALNGGWMKYLVGKLRDESDPTVRFRLLHSITALTRGNSRALRMWAQDGGRRLFLDILASDDSQGAMRLRILTFFSDISQGGDSVLDEESEPG